jgi:hypothetical protein
MAQHEAAGLPEFYPNHRLNAMAEVLAGVAAAASVIAIVRTTEDVIRKCSAYGVAYKNVSKDMSRLSDQVSGLRRVLLDLNKLIVAEEAQTFSRLPTFRAALDVSHDDQTPGEPLEVTKSVGEGRPGYGLTEHMLSEMAAKTLSSVLRSAQQQRILPLKDRFVRAVRCPRLPARQAPGYAEALRTLHAAILGCQIVSQGFVRKVPDCAHCPSRKLGYMSAATNRKVA